MLILQNGNTYEIHYSELNNGWMYEIYNEIELTPAAWANLEPKSDDGGLCTGSLEDAMEMAGIDIN